MEGVQGAWTPYLGSGAGLVAAMLAGLLGHTVVFFFGRRIARATKNIADDTLLRHARAPSRVLLPLLAMSLALPATTLPSEIEETARQVFAVSVIASVGWLVVALINAMATVIAERFKTDHPDNLAQRQVRTQTQIIRGIAVVIVIFVTVGAILATFPSVQHLGLSLFASAGVAGIVVGMAARPALSNLIAGLQIALTDPIRIDDVVIVEGEWGRIEEIRTTYVVVRIWDLRRLVVPLSYFIEKPFQNWTRQTADILGTVFLYTDYTVDVAAVRAELHRVLQDSPRWDGEVWGLQVTNSGERTLELRCLMGARNSPDAWDLRCEVREKLIEFLQRRHPEALPRLRADLAGADAAGPAGTRAAADGSRAGP